MTKGTIGGGADGFARKRRVDEERNLGLEEEARVGAQQLVKPAVGVPHLADAG